MSSDLPRPLDHLAASARAETAPPQPRRTWTLRRRLVVLTVGLFAVVGGAMGVGSTLALHDTLVDQLDQRLAESSQRAERAQGDRLPLDAGTGETPPGELPPDAPAPGTDATAAVPDTGDSALPGPPPALDAPGQAAGTVNYSALDDQVRSGYPDPDGVLQSLTAEQDATLATVHARAGPQTVDLGQLGLIRPPQHPVEHGVERRRGGVVDDEQAGHRCDQASVAVSRARTVDRSVPTPESRATSAAISVICADDFR